MDGHFKFVLQRDGARRKPHDGRAARAAGQLDIPRDACGFVVQVEQRQAGRVAERPLAFERAVIAINVEEDRGW